MNNPETRAGTLDALQVYAGRVMSATSDQEVFQAAEQAAQHAIGHQLFTIMIFDPDRMEVERCFSNRQSEYPTGGRKKKRDTEWGRHVLMQGNVYIGSNEDDIRWAFNDHDIITGMGLCAVLNIPIKRMGRVIGTMNLLDDHPHYDEADANVGGIIAIGLSSNLSVQGQKSGA